MKRIIKNLPHYLSLLGIFVVGILAFVFFSYDPAFKIAVIISIAVSYVVWGIMHHYLNKDLYLEVVLEYIAVAVLGLIIVFSLILES